MSRSRSIARLVAGVLLAATLGPMAARAQSPDPNGMDETDPLVRLELARVWADHSDFEQVIGLLYPVLFPEPVDALSRDARIEAYFLLGRSYFVTGQQVSAEDCFLRLLRTEPDYDVSPVLYSQALIRLIEDLKEAHRDELQQIREDLGRVTQPLESGEAVYVERRVEERSILVSMLPFGIGQFANDQPIWGATFLALEVGLASTSLGFWLANELEEEGGRFDDPDRARVRGNTHFATGIAFFSVLLLNVIHGLVIHEGVVEVSYGVVEPPSDLELDSEGGTWLPFAEPNADGGWTLGMGWQW